MEKSKPCILIQNFMHSQNFETSIRKTAGITRMKKLQLTIDMTPMVDLGFLLIAFFIFTTHLNQPAVTKLNMPADGDTTKVPQSRSLTILVADTTRLFYYSGTEEDALANKKIFQTLYSETGIGDIIRKKQISLGPAKDSLIVLIKPGTLSSYKNVISALDEMIINNVTRYSIVDMSPNEEKFLLDF
jgi:biopolymer transport protein ExbD